MSQWFYILGAPVVLSLMLVGIHSYLGFHVLKREVIFVDIGLSQVAALGATLTLFMGSHEEGVVSCLFSLLLCLIVAAALAFFRRQERQLSQEVIIGMTYALASGLLILIANALPHGSEHLKHALVGNILFVTWPSVGLVAIIYFILAGFFIKFHEKFWLASSGEQTHWVWDFLFYLLFGIVITFSTHHGGVLVVFTILVAPASIARRFFKSFKSQLLSAWAIGSLGILTSFILSVVMDLPSGATIVSVLSLIFFISLLGAYYLLRMRGIRKR